MKSTYSKFLFWGACSFFILLSGCSDSSSSPGEDDSQKNKTSKESIDGFVLFESSDKSITLGTSEKSAKANEKPTMKVELDYDFYIGKYEVTCGEFKKIITADFAKDCKKADIPITGVTFYDAVLFANAKTKAYNDKMDSQGAKARRDTAYTYTTAEFDSKGHCIYLEDYDFDPSANGFRLPTEAEWMFAANTNWDTKKSWNADNSDFELHKVCTADSTQNVCDMAGNAMEWVNDWLGNFKDTTLTDFVGAIDGGDLEKRIVKGGSYRVESSTIKMFSRGDIYTVTSSTYADYVGFRLAIGAIPNPTFLGEPSKKQPKSSSSKPTSSSSEQSSNEPASSFNPLDLDSAGVYYKSGGNENAIYLRNSMELLWTHRDSKLAIVGSSRSMAGVIPANLDESLDAINLSNIPNSIFVCEYLFKNYLVKHLKQLKYLVVALDIDMWWRDRTDSYDNFFYSDYKQFAGFVYDENHNFWDGEYPEGMAEATHDAYNLDFFATTYIPARGFKGESSGSWDNEDAVVGDSTWKEKKPELYEENFKTLESMVAIANENDITVIGVIFPMSPVYKTTGAFGRYGIRRSEAPELIQEIADISKKYKNFVLMDENKMGDHDYTDEMAFNTDHLSEKGAEQFTVRLDSLVKKLQ